MSGPVYFDFDKEIEQVAIFLNAESDILADKLEIRIRQMMTSGMGAPQIIDVLKRDLRGGGPLFSGFASTFKSQVFPVIDNVAQGAVIDQNTDALKWKWITTSYDPCDDCKPRHGQVKTYAEWEKLGLPRSGFSVCGDYCKCVLAPTTQVGASLDEGPVKIDTLAKAREDFQARLATDTELQNRMAEYKKSIRIRKTES